MSFASVSGWPHHPTSPVFFWKDREERFAHVFTKLRGLGLTEYEKAQESGSRSHHWAMTENHWKILGKCESMGTSMHYILLFRGEILEYDKLQQIAFRWRVSQIGPNMARVN